MTWRAVSQWRVAALCATVSLRGCTVGAAFLFAIALGPDAFGPIALLVVAVPLATMISTLGTDQALFREMVSTTATSIDYRTALRTLIVPVLMTPLLIAGVTLLAYAFSYSLWIFAISGMLAGLQAGGLLVVTAYYRALTDAARFLAVNICVAICSIGVRCTLLFAFEVSPVVSWVAGDAAVTVVSLVISAIWISKLRRETRAESFESRVLLRFGLPMTVHGIFQWVLGSSDRIVLGLILGSSALGMYGAVYQFAGVYNAAATEVNKTGLHRYAENREDVTRASRHDRNLLFLLWFAGVLPVIVAMLVLERSGYAGALLLGMSLYVSFLPLVFYLPVANAAAITHGRPSLLGIASAVGAGCNIAITALLAPSIGLYSGVLANAIGFFVMAACISLIGRTEQKRRTALV